MGGIRAENKELAHQTAAGVFFYVPCLVQQKGNLVDRKV